MKITKNTNVNKTNTSVNAAATDAVYKDAMNYIHCAINSLGDIATKDKSNVFAREAIANLSVVLLDLKSNK
jgi:hypothetical protein